MTETSRVSHVDRILSLCAGIAAVTAVVVSLYQASLARQQLRASAWPYVMETNGFVPGKPYNRFVVNEGVGPARVKDVRVLVDGKPVTTWAAVMRTLVGEAEPGMVYSSFHRGAVLPAGARLTLLEIPSGPRAQKFWVEGQTRLATVVCYCSIYDECWNADDREDEPRPVRSCSADTTGSFRQ